jgi:hypothetical protein
MAAPRRSWLSWPLPADTIARCAGSCALPEGAREIEREQEFGMNDDGAGRFVARRDELVVEDVNGGALIYDTRAGQAHWLEPDAAGVWRACAEARTLSAVAVDCGVTEAQAAEVLERLAALDLLEDVHLEPDRRTMLRRIALAGGALAGAGTIISTVLAPSDAFAAYTCYGPCTVPATFSCSQFSGVAFACAGADCSACAGTCACTLDGDESDGNCTGACSTY